MTQLGDDLGRRLRPVTEAEESRPVTATEMERIFGGRRQAAEAIKAADPSAPKVEYIMDTLRRNVNAEQGRGKQGRKVGPRLAKRYRVTRARKAGNAFQGGATVDISGTIVVSNDSRDRTLNTITLDAAAMRRVQEQPTDAARSDALWREAMAEYGMTAKGRPDVPTMMPDGPVDVDVEPA